jgi:antibiotic biosynthesis monooxygenase (ABM) superfamily enzyme
MSQVRKYIKEPVTAVFSWNVKPENSEKFQSLMHKIHTAAVKWPGHLGVTTLRPPKGRNDFQTVLRFDSYKHLENWLNSKERNELMASLDGIAETHTEEASGLETWFDIPGRLVIPPPRWKMATTTIIAIYPIALLVNIFIVPHILSWQVIFRSAVVPIIGPVVLTYCFMPLLTQKVLKNWLYKSR